MDNEIEEILNVLKKIFENKERLQESSKCEYIESLNKEFEDLLLWAFNGKDNLFAPTNNILDREKDLATWVRLHKDLPVPRVLLCEHWLSFPVYIFYLILDIYPLYLAEHGKV